jgi:uncharacterized RDD family membrane protein YckC
VPQPPGSTAAFAGAAHGVAVPPATPYLAYGVPAVAPPPPAAPSHAYASFWLRLAAYLIDWVLLTIALVGLVLALQLIALVGLVSSGQPLNDIGTNLAINGVLVLIAIVLSWLYYAGLEASPWQGTIGKRFLRLVVTDRYGRRIDFARATGRYFGKIASALTFFVGYGMVAFTARRQGLHDLMAGTYVVRQQHLSLVAAPQRPVQPQGSGALEAGRF